MIGTLVTEAPVWRTSLGDDAQMVRALGSIPSFVPTDPVASSKTGPDSSERHDAPELIARGHR